MKSKILKITGGTLLVLITFVSTVPWLFKGKIIHIVKAHINKDLRAHVNFSDLDISLFRHFPKITIGLDNVLVTCVGEFQGDTLVTAKQFDIVCDIRSLISGDSVKINSFSANEARFHVLINKEGHCNWNIIKSVTDLYDQIDSSIRPYKSEIQGYAIHNGYFDYLDERKDIHVVIVNLEHEGRGNFSSDLFTLNTRTTADAINFDFSGAIPNRLLPKPVLNWHSMLITKPILIPLILTG
jgi:hypothetical protein